MFGSWFRFAQVALLLLKEQVSLGVPYTTARDELGPDGEKALYAMFKRNLLAMRPSAEVGTVRASLT